MTAPDRLAYLQEKIWQGSIPLRVKLTSSECRTYDDSHVYMIQWPRVSYLPFLLTRLHEFFQPSLIDPETASHTGWFSFEGVPLKWQHPLGLLYDLFSGNAAAQKESSSSEPQAQDGQDLPWELTVHFNPSSWPSSLIPLSADGKVLHDVFINSIKEADHLRNGTARAIMSMGLDDGEKLWRGVQMHDLRLFSSVNDKLMNAGAERGERLRHVPIKVYLPSTTPAVVATSPIEEDSEEGPSQTRGTLKVVQMPVAPTISVKETQTLGTALHSMLPSLFPSRRSYIHAHAVLHGAVAPLSAPLEDLMRSAAYCDGFLHVGVVMIG